MEPGGVTLILNGVVSLIMALAGAGLFQYRSQKRKNNSESDVNEANAQLLEGQLTINLSKESRELIELYKKSHASAEVKADRAIAAEEKQERRVDFLINYLRSQQIAVPDWPEDLR